MSIGLNYFFFAKRWFIFIYVAQVIFRLKKTDTYLKKQSGHDV